MPLLKTAQKADSIFVDLINFFVTKHYNQTVAYFRDTGGRFSNRTSQTLRMLIVHQQFYSRSGLGAGILENCVAVSLLYLVSLQGYDNCLHRRLRMSETQKQYTSFKEFYPFYLQEHQNTVCRRLHFVGSTLVLGILSYALVHQSWLLLLALPLVGYGFAWVGHFFYEKNRPATFVYPMYSFWGDWVMYKDMLTGKIKW